jgi:hypothetical protein
MVAWLGTRENNAARSLQAKEDECEVEMLMGRVVTRAIVCADCQSALAIAPSAPVFAHPGLVHFHYFIGADWLVEKEAGIAAFARGEADLFGLGGGEFELLYAAHVR